MPNRTVKIQGWGTGTASLTAVLDGETVFSGDVVLEELTEDNSAEQTAPTLFTFEIPVDFGGSKQMKITVGNAPVRFGQIIANYTECEYGEIYYTGPYGFADIAPIDTTGSGDPRDEVKIDGTLQIIDRQDQKGTWHWVVNPGSVFEHKIIIKEGSELEF
jgi:hypothetical protein